MARISPTRACSSIKTLVVLHRQAICGKSEVIAGSRCPVMRTMWTVRVLAQRAGFSLIELLVVIAIIGIVIALLVPSLGKARALARQTREQAGAAQVMLAYSMYADDNKGYLLAGYPKREWVNGAMAVFNADGERLMNEEAQRYPFRLAPYLNYNFRGLYQSDRLLADLRERESTYTPYGINYDYVVSLYPSLGLNAAFVGGSDRVQGFDRLFQSVFGRVHIARLDQCVRTSGVITFASARAEEQPAVEVLGKPEGFFRIDPPRFAASSGALWEASYDAASQRPGVNSGFLSLRHGNRAVAAYLDGHINLVTWEQANDMRRWADQADSPGWSLRPR